MRMKIFIFIIPFFFLLEAHSCEFINLTGESSSLERKSFLDEDNKSGVRLAWNGMKGKNKKYLQGTVDKAVASYEKKWCSEFFNDDFKTQHPGANMKIYKTDFKGYLVTCSPSKECFNIDIMKELRAKKLFSQRFVSPYNKEEIVDFRLTGVRAKNFKEGYVKARASEIYPDYDGKSSISEFLDMKLKEGIKKLTGKEDIKSFDLNNNSLMFKLNSNISKWRADELDRIDPQFLELVKALDAMEVPFLNSNNFDEELSQAFKGDGKIKKGYTLSSAKSGDDMVLIIKKGGKVSKIVGVDAKGLGNVNFVTRLESYLKSGKAMESDSDLFNISYEAIKRADKKMLKSMDTYKEVVLGELRKSKKRDIDVIVAKSHNTYRRKRTLAGDSLMEMRAGAINPCGGSNECVLDKITTIHNTLKVMENSGIEGHFGDSCIGTEYWARRLGAKELKSLD